MAKNRHILELSNLSIGYRSKKQRTIIAKDINVAADFGKLVSVLGRNGIGKSTLLRTIAKIQPKIEGDIILNNKNLSNYSSNKLAKKVSLVLTEQIPVGNLTVYELIALGRQPYTNWLGVLTTEDKKQINLAIEKLELENLLDSRCDELSDGQLQRVLICRAVAQDTDLIILDEPTAHLDVQNRMVTFKLLQQLAHELKKTVLISTHEVQLAIHLSDQLWLMTEEGLINGDPKTIVDNDIINKIFDPKIVHFDKKNKQFLVR